MDDFYSVIKEHFGSISPKEFSRLISYFREDKMSKNDFFVRKNQYCRKLSLVKSGVLRMYSISDGKEVTQWIATPNTFVTDISSFFFDQPSRWNIQALSDVEILTLDKTNYTKLSEEFPKWNEIEKRLFAKCFAMLEDRVYSHLSMSAEERYNYYFRDNASLFHQVPLHMIASVLGMTPETFSRIRKRQHIKS